MDLPLAQVLRVVYRRPTVRIIEQGHRQKRRQRSSLLFGIPPILHMVLMQFILVFTFSLCNSSYFSNRPGAKQLARQEIESILPPSGSDDLCFFHLYTYLMLRTNPHKLFKEFHLSQFKKKNIFRDVEKKDVTRVLEIHIFITQFFHKFDLRTTMLVRFFVHYNYHRPFLQ